MKPALLKPELKKPELKRPELKRPEPVSEPAKTLFEPSGAPSASSAAPAETLYVAPTGPSSKVTVEYQRQRAKEMVAFFKEQKLQEQITKATVFGWTPKNEIGNGRWVMFGLLVGILTEYSTGVSFIDQLKLLVSYLGIVDLE